MRALGDKKKNQPSPRAASDEQQQARGRMKPVSEPHAMIRAKPPPLSLIPEGFWAITHD